MIRWFWDGLPWPGRIYFVVFSVLVAAWLLVMFVAGLQSVVDWWEQR